ncbi:hypothetical protein ACIHJG_08695 [Streptomyces sp. NPDC052415]
MGDSVQMPSVRLEVLGEYVVVGGHRSVTPLVVPRAVTDMTDRVRMM